MNNKEQIIEVISNNYYDGTHNDNNQFKPQFINKTKDLKKVLHNNKKIEQNFEYKLNNKLKKYSNFKDHSK